MKGTGKFLTVVFVVLFIVLIGELVYIFNFSSGSKKTPNGSPVPTLTIDQVNQIESSRKNPNQAISDDMIGVMQNISDEVVVSSVNKSIYRGTILTMNLDNEGLKLSIVGASGKGNTFIYDPEQLSKMTFFQRDAENKIVAIDIIDIAVEDFVEIEDNTDLLSEVDKSFLPGKITVIKR